VSHGSESWRRFSSDWTSWTSSSGREKKGVTPRTRKGRRRPLRETVVAITAIEVRTAGHSKVAVVGDRYK